MCSAVTNPSLLRRRLSGSRTPRAAFPIVILTLWLLQTVAPAATEEATFLRGYNLNGPAVSIDGRPWDGDDATGIKSTGKRFENQAVALKPPTDRERSRMIRSSIWGNKVDLTVDSLPNGPIQVLLYVWEDNHSEQFDILVNDRPVAEKLHSGIGGTWKKLGPWAIDVTDGRLKVSARTPSHGAANLSGLEIWTGTGPIPKPKTLDFVANPSAEQIEFFERRIRPVLAEHCYECHSGGAKKLKGGLLLDSRMGLVQGGDTGPVLTPGQPDASLLIQAVRHVDASLAMPPNKKLSAMDIDDLAAWVSMGAPDPRTEAPVATNAARPAIDWTEARQWWSFRPLLSSGPPAVQTASWPVTDLDRFILHRLENENLRPATDADPRTLLRRATFDLTGLPPSTAEMESFLRDTSPEAFAKVVDRLLASSAYGERWGRHWLDVVRYADTAGDNSDFPIPQIHRYRDWVINAFNQDLPYDQFVREQLAGDLLPSSTPEESHARTVATGYIANARRFGSRVDDYPQHLTIEDTLDNVGRAFLGLTINCARCHDHKFDPIPTTDYYALYGVFDSTRYPWPGIELEQKQRDLIPLVPSAQLSEAESKVRAFDTEKRRLDKEVQKLKDSLKETPAEQKKDVEARIQAAEAALKDFVRQGLPFELAYAVTEAPKRGDATVQIKGDPSKPGASVPRRFLSVLGGFELPAGETSSGRRHLADWIVSPTNALAARVIVNRIWLHHFGKGLVPTPNDFGKQGKPPTHPELLDWLASRFIASGGSIKSMHRLIMRSRTYRMSSRQSAESVARDPNNESLSFFPRRRLDAESIRDSLLVLGDHLDTSPAGPHPFPPQSDWKFTQHNPFRAVYESNRRSVYLMTQRIQRHPYLAIFDGADPSASTAARVNSTTPLQALFLLNDRFVHEQARAFSSRILNATTDFRKRLGFAFENALARPPSDREVEAALQFHENARRRLEVSGSTESQADTDAWEAFVRVLFRLNEFVYID